MLGLHKDSQQESGVDIYDGRIVICFPPALTHYRLDGGWDLQGCRTSPHLLKLRNATWFSHRSPPSMCCVS